MVKFENGEFGNECPRLIFQGEEYILVNADGGRTEGAIATEEQYENFELSCAHLNEDGTITCYGEVIGNISEIEWLE